MSSSVVLIVNPCSGSFSEKRLMASIELLKERFKDVSLFYTAGRGDAEAIAKDAVKRSPEMIMVVGGDGTFNEVVNGAAFTDVPVAFIPAGTTNVLARELAIPCDVYKATMRAMSGCPEYITLGSISYKIVHPHPRIKDGAGSNPPNSPLSKGGMEGGLPLGKGGIKVESRGRESKNFAEKDPPSPGGRGVGGGGSELLLNHRYFVLMAGIGFDGEAVYGVSERVKRLSGKGAYMLSGLKAFMRYSPDSLRIVVDDTAYEGYGLIVCNAGYYAGSFRACLDASLRSPELCVLIMHGKRRTDLLRYVVGIVRGRQLNLKEITYTRGRKIAVEGDAHIQIDGDYLGRTPAEITLQERALRLIA